MSDISKLKDTIDYFECLAFDRLEEIGRLQDENERYKTVLNDLCKLKKMKDQLGKTPEYKHFQPIAWEQAFELLEQESNE